MNVKSKTLEKILIPLFIIIFLLIGFIIYERAQITTKKNEKIITNDYYNIEFLWGNGYIKEPETIDKTEKNISMYLDGKNILHIKTKTKKIEINGLPETNIKLYYTKIKENCYELAGLDKNDLYYQNICINKSTKKTFEKISTNAKGIYISAQEKENINLLNKTNFKTNFIISTQDDKIKYIEKKDNVLGLYNEIKDIKPYFDYICITKNNLCQKTKAYITFDKELILPNLENSLKKSIGETLTVEDIFAQIKEGQDKNYLYTIYILDKDGKLYSIDLKTKKQTPFAVCVKEEKVKTIKYDEENKKIENIIITYINGDYKKITNTNDNIITSTIYDKKENSLIKQ